MTRPAMTEARRRAVHGKLVPMDEPTLRDKLRALNRARREAGEVSIWAAALAGVALITVATLIIVAFTGA